MCVNIFSIQGPGHSERISIRRHSKKQQQQKESILYLLLEICALLCFIFQKKTKPFPKGCTTPNSWDRVHEESNLGVLSDPLMLSRQHGKGGLACFELF